MRNIRLLDPDGGDTTLQQQQANLAYTTLQQPVGRPLPDHRAGRRSTAPTQVVLSTRDLNLSQAPRSSVGGPAHRLHPRLRPGPVGGQRGDGQRVARLPGARTCRPTIDPSSDHQGDRWTEPQVYFSEQQSGYAIVGSTRDEVDYLDANGSQSTSSYNGTGGRGLNSWVQAGRVRPALRRLNPLISNFVTHDSKILYVRDIRARVQTVAPFLSFDHDPYPVVVDGKIKYIIDAYTTSDHYPNAQRADNVGPGHRQRAEQDLQLRPQLGEGGGRRLRRHGHDVRDRPERPDHPGLRGGVPQAVHRDRQDAGPILRTTCATRRTCSGCRPTCGAATTSTIRSPSTSQTNGWSMAQDPGTRW